MSNISGIKSSGGGDISVATSSTLGGIKINYSENGKNYPVELDNQKAYVNVPWTDTTYTLPVASNSSLGGIKLNYTENDKNYPVELDNQRAFVNVPWTDSFTAAKDTKLTNLTSDATRIDVYSNELFVEDDINLETSGNKIKLANSVEFYVSGTEVRIDLMDSGDKFEIRSNGSDLLRLNPNGNVTGNCISNTLTSSTSNNTMVRAKGIRECITSATIAKNIAFSSSATIDSAGAEGVVPDMNALECSYTWENFTADSNHVTQPNSIEFQIKSNCEISVSLKLHCTNGQSNNRSLIYGYVEHARSSTLTEYPIGGCYYKDDSNQYDDIIIAGTINIMCQTNDTIMIKTKALYRQNTGQCLPNVSNSFLRIEKYNYTTTIS